MKKLNLFFTILLMLGIGFCPPLKAQTQIVKTLDDPGRAPKIIGRPFLQTDNSIALYMELLYTQSLETVSLYSGFSISPQDFIFRFYLPGYPNFITLTIYENGTLQADSSINYEKISVFSTPPESEKYQYTIQENTINKISIEIDPFVASQNGSYVEDGIGKINKIDGTGPALSFFGEDINEDSGRLRLRLQGVINDENAPNRGTFFFSGIKGTPITFTAEELAILNDANGRSFVMRQTATNATSVVNIPAQADAAAIGQAIKTAGVPHTIYIQPEVKNDGSLKIYADEAFTLEGDEILSISQHNVFEQKVAVYPNPTTEVLYLDHKESAEITYVVYDMTGKQMQTTHSKGAQHLINVELLAPGVYLLEATTGKQKKQWRFVKE